jgi:hypothetical protein
MDDQRVGSSLRSLRLRRRLRQKEASIAADIPRSVANLIEVGRLDAVRFGDIRRYAKVLGARFDGSVLWQGADLDRMLNRGHARLHEAMATWLASIAGWIVVPEVSFSYRGDRGVIDIVAWHAATRTLLVIELKRRRSPRRTSGGKFAGSERRSAAQDVLGHDQPVNLVGALIDLGALGIAHQALDPGLP